MDQGWACQFKRFLCLGLESRSSESRNCPNDFCPRLGPRLPVPKVTEIYFPWDDFGAARILGTRVLGTVPGFLYFSKKHEFPTKNAEGRYFKIFEECSRAPSHRTQVPKIPIGPMGLQNPTGLKSQGV